MTVSAITMVHAHMTYTGQLVSVKKVSDFVYSLNLSRWDKISLQLTLLHSGLGLRRPGSSEA